MSIHVKIRGMPEDASKHVTHPIKSTARLRFDKTWVWGKLGGVGGWNQKCGGDVWQCMSM